MVLTNNPDIAKYAPDDQKGYIRSMHYHRQTSGGGCLLTQDIAGSVHAMTTLKLVARVLLPCLLWAGAAVWAGPDIQVERKQDSIHIEASLHVAAHHHVAWQVLTDYDNLASFVPGLQTSRGVSGAGEPLLLRQAGQSGHVVPGFWVPPLVGSAVIGQDVRNMLTGVTQEIQRRAAAPTSAGAARIVRQ